MRETDAARQHRTSATDTSVSDRRLRMEAECLQAERAPEAVYLLRRPGADTAATEANDPVRAATRVG